MDFGEKSKLKIGNLETRIPIIQGGMGVCISLSGLASAVAEEGGIGVIATAGIGYNDIKIVKNFQQANELALRREIRESKKRTQGFIGVNIMLALTDSADYIRFSIEEGADFVFLGAGLPIYPPPEISPDQIADSPTKIVPIVSSARAVRIILKGWEKYNCQPHAFVIEGPLAGGHLGFKLEDITDPKHSLENIFREVKEIIKPWEDKKGVNIPIVVAGGIYSGADIYRYLKMGADGVQMATRFVATHECDAYLEFKKAFLKSEKEDLMIIKSPVGLPGRAIRNQFLIDVEKGEKKPFHCPWKCLRTCDYKNVPYCIAKALTNAKVGRLQRGFAFAGANAYKVDKIISVKELINTLKEEYAQATAAAG